MAISVITTVKNEEKSIVRFLDSLAAQTVPPDEVIIVDGDSSDATFNLIQNYRKLPVRALQVACNISEGRNLAIRHATSELIAVTDAGCFLDPHWLEEISKFDSNTDVVAGNYRAAINSLFDACQYSLNSLFKFGKSLDTFVISSRSIAFRKRLWEETGGYPEWLDYSEDMYFHLQLRKRSEQFRFAPAAIVEWEQRPTVAQMFRQFFRYMRGDGKAGLHTRRHLIRFATYLGGTGLLALSILHSPLWLLPLVAGLGLYLSAPCLTFVRLRRYKLTPWAVCVIAFLLVVMDTAKMAGYISGLTWAWRHRKSEMQKLQRFFHGHYTTSGASTEPAS